MAAVRETAKVIDIPLPEFADFTSESMPRRERVATRAVTAMGAHTAIFKNVREVQLKNTQERCCTDQWLDENESEWMIEALGHQQRQIVSVSFQGGNR